MIKNATGVDLFSLGRAATKARAALQGDACVFTRSRRLLATGAWLGPKDAADSYVEEADVDANGGLEACLATGVRTLLTASFVQAKAAQTLGLRCFLRLPYASGEPADLRLARLQDCAAHLTQGLKVEGVIPTPVGEAFGLDTLAFMAQCRIHLHVPTVVADFARLGHRLAQMSLAFGVGELLGPIVSERALRLGDNANNPAMTRKEVCVFVQGAGLLPRERLSGGRTEEVTL